MIWRFGCEKMLFSWFEKGDRKFNFYQVSSDRLNLMGIVTPVSYSPFRSVVEYSLPEFSRSLPELLHFLLEFLRSLLESMLRLHIDQQSGFAVWLFL